MNKQRRAELEKLATRIEDVRADLESVRDDEQNAFDQMPESLQSSERGQKAENAVSYFEDAIGSLHEAHSTIESACE